MGELTQEQQAVIEQDELEAQQERDRLAAEEGSGEEPRMELSAYVVQKAVEFESPDKVMWEDIETVEIPRKAPRKNALQVVLEGMGADPATGTNDEAEGEYRVIPVSIAKPLVVKIETTQAAVIG